MFRFVRPSSRRFVMFRTPFFKALVRRKYLTNTNVSETKLERCLSTFDLTFLGVGSTLGLGIYVIAGQVASITAGPAVTISFLIAAVASVFSALCYAEFGARVPKAGSAYVYSYVTVGEIMAFIIGWNLILEYVIGTASVARGYSGYLDSLVNGTIQEHITKYMPMTLSGLSSYPDFLAFGITFLLTIMLAVGVKESSRFNNLFTGLNLLIVLYVVITGSFKADIKNWNLSPDQVHGHGKGGFIPYGFSGIMAGAATCFYGYIGFDCIATTGEEVKNPQKAIPFSIITSLFIVFSAYFGISTIQTLMWPYYDQNQPAPLPYVFDCVGWPLARWIISIGALAGLSTSLLGGMFPLPRVLYAMASDGLIFRFLANINHKFKTPMIATFLSGIFAGVMAMIFDVHELAAMMSIGTLLAYTLVATSVLLLRYRILDERVQLVPVLRPNAVAPSAPSLEQPPEMQKSSIMQEEYNVSSFAGSSSTPTDFGFRDGSLDSRNRSMNASVNTMLSSTHYYTAKDVLKMFFNWENADIQTSISSQISVLIITIICILIFVLNLLLVTLQNEIFDLDILPLFFVFLFIILIMVMVYALYVQPSENQGLLFKVPCVPFIPVLSIFINIYLMMNLSDKTWIRFAVWMAIGFVIYFGYGINNSNERTSSPPVLPCIYESEADNEEEVKHERSPLLTRLL